MTIIIEFRVAPSDMGKVIGRQGRTAKAIRTLLNAAGMRSNRRVEFEIVNTE
ncbi:KH domain-containing protein, partial [bacterium]|nr:KH domain-containing protein [bacterium]